MIQNDERTTRQDTPRSAEDQWGWRLETTGAVLIRYSLVIVLLWVGALKFTAYEAELVANFVENSPRIAVRPFSWLIPALGS